MGAAFYDEHVCQYSRKGENSPYKCRCYECKHHAKYVPDGEVEFWEFNPFGKSTLKCPFYRTKAQMIIKSNKQKRESDKPTAKQLLFIKQISDEIGDEFTGTTKSEARQWISGHIQEYKNECFLRELDSWAIAESIDARRDW